MSAKRKAAAHVFQEQNVLKQAVLDQDAVPGEALAEPASGIEARLIGKEEVVSVPSLSATGGRPRRPHPKSERQDQAVTKVKTSEELQLEKEPLQVRETGVLFWRRIIAPPNAYVVHTRMGKVKTLGLGASFRYNPNTDAYLIVPAAMQTIGVVANCISKEKQGINVLAYVQWQIDDFSVAYRKLDLSDSRDPLGIVNAQLGEQAEAAIKDKISTMSVEEVLTDKAPVIEELTTRLKAVAEGRQQGTEVSEGLGIKIVTVQIKEAIVSSQQLWEDLQAPFRHEQEKSARISYLSMQDEIQQKELATTKAVQTREAETRVEIERITQSKETEAAELRLREEGQRFSREQEATRQKVELQAQTTIAEQESAQRVAAEQKRLEIEQAMQSIAEEGRLAEARVAAEQKRIEQETLLKEQEAALTAQLQAQEDALALQVLQANLTRQREDHQLKLELERENHQLKLEVLEKEVELARLQQEVNNLVNERDLVGRLIEKLPELAAEMPEIKELKVLQTGSSDGSYDALASFLSRALALTEYLGLSLPAGQKDGKSNSAEE